MNILVSVIIPVYNAGTYLRRSLDSVAGQSFGDFEVILVDDGSSDESGKTCDEYSLRDSRFKVIHKERGGASSARNAGLELACGQWIFFMDSDDLLHPQAIELVLRGASSGLEFVVADFHYGFPGEDNPFSGVPESFGEVKPQIISREDYFRMLFSLSMKEATRGMSIWNKLYSRKLIGTSRFSDHTVSEDALFNFNILMKTRRIAFIDAKTYSYTQSPAGLSHTRIAGNNLEQVRVYDEMWGILKSSGEAEDMEMIEALTLAKLFRKLLTSRYHLTDPSQIKEWKAISKKILSSTREDYWSNRHIPLKEKMAFSLFSVVPGLVWLFMKATHN